MHHLICHVRAGEVAEATTPCAPLENGNALVATEIVTKRSSNQRKKKNKRGNYQRVFGQVTMRPWIW